MKSTATTERSQEQPIANLGEDGSQEVGNCGGGFPGPPPQRTTSPVVLLRRGTLPCWGSPALELLRSADNSMKPLRTGSVVLGLNLAAMSNFDNYVCCTVAARSA